MADAARPTAWAAFFTPRSVALVARSTPCLTELPTRSTTDGSLLAGKPYPGSKPPEPGPGAATADSPIPDDRIDEILHTLHRIQGEIADLRMAVAELAARLPAPAAKPEAPDGARGGA